MAAPTGPFFDGLCRAPRRKPRTGNVWDNCILLSDQAGFVWGTGQFTPNNAGNDAAKVANDAAMNAGIAAALAARKPLYIGRQGVKGWFATSAFTALSRYVQLVGDGPRGSIWIAEPVTGASAGEKQQPTCNLRMGGDNKLINFTRKIVGASVRNGLLTSHHIVPPADGNTQADNFELSGLHVVGGAASAIFFMRSKNIRTSCTETSGSLADAFHLDYLVKNVSSSNHKAINCGDDAYAVVGPQNTDNITNVRVSHVHSVRSQTRGLVFSGGEDLHARYLYAKNSANWGFLVTSVASPFFTHFTKRWSLQDARVFGTGSTYSCFNVTGRGGINALTGLLNSSDDGYMLRCVGRAAGGSGNGLSIGPYVKDFYADIDVALCTRGFSLSTSWNNVEIVGRIAKMNRAAGVFSGGAFTGEEAAFHGGYLLVHDIVMDALAYGTVDSLFKFTGSGFEATSPQLNALSRFEFYNLTQTYGNHPFTGAALGSANFSGVRFEIVQTTQGKSVRIANSTFGAGISDFKPGWTQVSV